MILCMIKRTSKVLVKVISVFTRDWDQYSALVLLTGLPIHVIISPRRWHFIKGNIDEVLWRLLHPFQGNRAYMMYSEVTMLALLTTFTPSDPVCPVWWHCILMKNVVVIILEEDCSCTLWECWPNENGKVTESAIWKDDQLCANRGCHSWNLQISNNNRSWCSMGLKRGKTL